MNKAEARQLAVSYVASESAVAGVEFALLDTCTIEKSFGWVFFYDTKEFLETGNELARAVGNAPLIVDRHTGKMEVAGTAYPIEHYLLLYEQYGTCHPKET